MKGEPSYNTRVAPTARADTNQFHIIQPVYGGKEGGRGERVSVCMWKPQKLLWGYMYLSCEAYYTYSSIVEDDIIAVHVAMEKVLLQVLN